MQKYSQSSTEQSLADHFKAQIESQSVVNS